MQLHLGVSQTTNLWDLVWYSEHLITWYYFLLSKFEASIISYVGLPYNLKGQIDPLISIPTCCLIPWHIPEYPNVASRTKFHKIKKETLARLSDMYPCVSVSVMMEEVSLGFVSHTFMHHWLILLQTFNFVCFSSWYDLPN